jgi:hypothetical protein
MEREFTYDLEVDPTDPELPEPPVDVHLPPPPPTPPEEPPRRGGPARGPGPSDPATGPWFTLSMAVYVAFTGLVTASVLVGGSGGEAAAYAISLGLLVLYVGFLIVGASWFHHWRRK